MAENTDQHKNQEEKVEQQKEAVKQGAKGLWMSISTFLKELLDFREDTDREATIELIKADIPLKGATAWILVCSIFIASIGLNANSIPVVIGAMLISPLMGPILGIGLSIAVNDIDTLRKSLVNFAVMVGLSVFTAWLFSTLFPLRVESSELLARTKPDIRDVLIAFFGGLALIIARTKRGTIASVIFGVAIGTALMPPLCTVGFGLAIGNYSYAIGAMYLFTINTIFIALATFIVLKLLKFPMLRYANSAKRKRIAQLASIVGILVMIPAIYTFVITLRESKAQADFDQFIANEVEANDELYLRKFIYNYEDRKIKLIFDGEVTDATISDLKNEVLRYENIRGFEVNVWGNKARGIDQVSKAYDRAISELDRLQTANEMLAGQVTDLKSQIIDLENQLRKVHSEPSMPYLEITKDAKINFPDLKTLAYGSILHSNFVKVDTVQTIFPTWKFKVIDSLDTERKEILRAWIAKQLKVDTLAVQ